jgi:hypothetical protein
MKTIIKFWNYLIEWGEEIHEYRRKYYNRGMY